MARLTAPRPLIAADERNAFDCGRESLNHWFRRHAWINQENDASRTNVVCDTSEQRIAGFVSLCAAQIERAYLPKASQRNRPDPLPVILLGQLAVDTRYQGKGCARSLMQYALLTALRFSEDIDCTGIVTHPLDDGVRSFYGAFDFQELPFDPSRRMMVRTVDLKRAV